jgi:hypothetical protein
MSHEVAPEDNSKDSETAKDIPMEKTATKKKKKARKEEEESDSSTESSESDRPRRRRAKKKARRAEESDDENDNVEAQQGRPVSRFITPPAKPQFADPGPLGLAAFGLTTWLLNLHNTEAIGAGALPIIFGMGIFFGGIVQLIAGVLEWIKGNSFGFVAFTSYGAFWLAFVSMFLFPKAGMSEPFDHGSVCAFLFIWGVFTTGMELAALKKRLNYCLQVLFCSLALLFYLLALAFLLRSQNHMEAGRVVNIIAGAEGMCVGLLAMYMCFAEMNEWPLFPMALTFEQRRKKEQLLFHHAPRTFY